jgi:myosin-crossreactive antigen
MKFLLNEMSETELKRELQFRDKYNSKTRDVRDIYTMYTDTAGDLLRQYVLDVSAEDAIIDELIELTMYTNTVIERIRARYRSRTPPNIIL